MIDVLIELGFSEEEVMDFQIQYQDLLDIDIGNIKNKILILENLNFNFEEIKNIILTNPIYLNKTNEEILNLINTLTGSGISDIKNLISINPYILSLDGIDIEKYFIEKMNEGILKEDIIDSLEEDPMGIQ